MELATYCEAKGLLDQRAGSLVEAGRREESKFTGAPICPDKSIHIILSNDAPRRYFTACEVHSEEIHRTWNGWSAISLETNTVIWNNPRGRTRLISHAN